MDAQDDDRAGDGDAVGAVPDDLEPQAARVASGSFSPAESPWRSASSGGSLVRNSWR